MEIDDVDEDKFLEGLERLQDEAGDWRQHLPYEAVVRYRTNPAIPAKFREHVNRCAYCQDLIDLYRRA